LAFLGPLSPLPAGSSSRPKVVGPRRAGPSALIVSAAGWPGDAEPPEGRAGRRDSELLVRRRPQPHDVAHRSRDREVSMPGLPVGAGSTPLTRKTTAGGGERSAQRDATGGPRPVARPCRRRLALAGYRRSAPG